MTMPTQENVGRYARSVESGWKGKIVGVDGECYRMMGVNFLAEVILGEEHLDLDDTQWFVPDDLRMI